MPYLDSVAREIGYSESYTRLLLRQQGISVRRGWVNPTYLPSFLANRRLLTEERAGRRRRDRWGYYRRRGSPPTAARASAPVAALDPSGLHITIGADPEFEIYSAGGQSIPADRLGGTSAALGVDGDGFTGEMRPRYGTPEAVTTRIDSLMTDLAAALTDGEECVAGEGRGRPTGGHIHIGGLDHNDSRVAGVIAALDSLIYTPLKSVCDGRRRTSSYDGPSLYRRQPHGIEYRSPPSWLAHPILTKGALTIAFIVAQNPTTPPTTKEGVLALCDSGERTATVESFYLFIESMNRDGRRLEDLPVLRSWGKRPAATRPTPTARIGTHVVSVSGDENMPYMTRHGDSSLVFIGAASERAPVIPTVFIPRGLRNTEAIHRAMTTHEAYPIHTRTWEYATIGLGRPVRSSPEEAARVINEILDAYESP